MAHALGPDGLAGQAVVKVFAPECWPDWPKAYRLKRGGGALYRHAMIFRIRTFHMAAFARAILAFGLLLTFSAPASAQDREVPYWASINTEELNMRVGPSMQYRIEWVYRREGLPVKVIRVVDRWRLIEDSDGTKGWVSSNLLSLQRGAVVTGDGLAPIRDMPSDGGKLKWNAEPGVVGKLGDCEAGWCEIDVEGHTGWIAQDQIWGAGEP